MRVFSSGGGVQSTAALVLSAQGVFDFSTHVFANVGDDSENPETVEYVKDVIRPYAEAHGVEFIEAHKKRQGKYEQQTILGEIYRRKRSVVIPARMSNGAPGNRTCTIDFKIRVVDKWVAENGGRGSDVFIGLGITTDEIHRARFAPPEAVRGFTKNLVYPFIEQSITRSAAQAIVAAAGLPTPPRSACWFCPFHTRSEWLRLKNKQPHLFERAVNLERYINEKRECVMGKDKVYLHSSAQPLDQAVGDQMMFDDLDNCESGYCWT